MLRKLAGLVIGLALLVEPVVAAHGQGRPRGSPYRFRRVFERQRSSVVQVRNVNERTRWRTGFLAGARGELVFGSPQRPEDVLKWRADDGVERPAKLISYDAALKLAVARGPIRPRVTPLVPSKQTRLRPERWVVTIRHGKKGKAVPHAGVITARRRKGGRVIEVRGQLGAPVLDLDGGLVGVVVRGGRRSAVVAPLAKILPFLKKAVLGGAH